MLSKYSSFRLFPSFFFFLLLFIGDLAAITLLLIFGNISYHSLTTSCYVRYDTDEPVLLLHNTYTHGASLQRSTYQNCDTDTEHNVFDDNSSTVTQQNFEV